MNKDQFRLQVYNNRYTRGVVVTICKIIIWTLIYVMIIGLIATILGQDFNSTANLYNFNSGPSAGMILGSLIILAVTVAYYWAIITEIVHKIKQNKQLTQYEDDYLNNNAKSSKE